MNVEKTRKKKAEFAPSRTDIARPSELSREVDSMFNQFRRSFEDLLSPLLPTTSSSSELQIRHPPVDLVDHVITTLYGLNFQVSLRTWLTCR